MVLPFSIGIEDRTYRSSLCRRSKWSEEYTSDGKARNDQSIDFINFKDYGATVGVPEAFQIHENNRIPMDYITQWWYFDVLCTNAYGIIYNDMNSKALKEEARHSWYWLMKHGICFNNHGGVDEYRDYIRQKNLTKDLISWEPLILSDNMVQLESEKVYDIRKNYLNLGFKHYPHYKVRVINASKPNELPKIKDFLKNPFVCHKCTTATGNKDSSGNYIHGVFWQFREKCVYPLWALRGEAYIATFLLS